MWLHQTTSNVKHWAWSVTLCQLCQASRERHYPTVVFLGGGGGGGGGGGDPSAAGKIGFVNDTREGIDNCMPAFKDLRPMKVNLTSKYICPLMWSQRLLPKLI